MRIHRFAPCGLAVWALLVSVVLAAPPTGWRGDASGVFDASSPPTAWTNEEHIVWKTSLPGSNSCPIVVGDRIFACAEPHTLACLDAADGSILWQQSPDFESVLPAEVWSAAQADLQQAEAIRTAINKLQEELNPIEQQLQEAPEDEALKGQVQKMREEIEAQRLLLPPLEKYRVPERSAGCSTATPASDGERVYVTFGTGIAAAYDIDGNRLWARWLEQPQLDWGHTASPVLAGQYVLVHFKQLQALDRETGETVWTADVPASYGSPVPCRCGQTDIMVTAAGDIVRLTDGAVLAKGITDPLTRSSPVVQDGVAYFVESRARAFRLTMTEKNRVEAAPLWETRLLEDNYYASPLVHDGLVYTVSEGRVMTVLDAADGSVAYEERLRFKERGPVVSSLTSAGNMIYVVQETGRAKLVQAGRDYAELAENPLESIRSSPAFSERRIYFRTLSNVVCCEN